MSVTRQERGKRELSETCIAVLNVRRCQIATREADVEKVVLQARQGSDRRVRATSGKCSAENELEEALLELTVRKCNSLATLRACGANAPSAEMMGVTWRASTSSGRSSS